MRPAALTVALWPVWVYSAQRLTDGSDEPWGLLAMVTILFVIVKKKPHLSTVITSPLLLLYALALPWAPPLFSAALAVSALAALTRSPGIWGLSLLSLPLLASLQFYLGYPLRVLAGEGAALMIRVSGFPVTCEGAVLQWGTQQVLIDAPCSGVHMLWAALYLVFTLAALNRWSLKDTAGMTALAVALTVAGNAWRAAALFYLEAGILPLPAWCHEGVGVVVFALTAAALTLPQFPETSNQRQQDNPTLFHLACAAALVAGFVPTPAQPKPAGFPGWPATFDNRPLRQQDLSPQERSFDESFPGHTARFTDGTREIILRWVATPTRRLHPAADCFRAHGHTITPGPVWQDEKGRPWGTFTAGPLQVRERIEGADGTEFTDVSAWYWAALTGRTRGPWWVTTVAKM